MADRRRPKQERAQATVDAVIEAAARIVVEEGYDRLSTNRVAEKAGVSVGTLYQYFASKEQIVNALAQRIAEERLARLGATLEALVDTDLDLQDAVRLLLEATIDAMRVRPELARRLILEAPRTGRTDVEAIWRRRAIDLVRAVLHRRREVFRDAADLELVAWIVVTACFAVLQDASAYRPELLAGDVLRDELTRLAHRYLAQG